jgi:aminopeptidase N
MRHFFIPAFAAILTIFLACTPKVGPKIASTPSQPTEPSAWDSLGKPVLGVDDSAPIEYSFEEPKAFNLDSLPPYNPSHTFEVDLIHTKVEISFDWAKKRANGKATLTMRPWFYETNQVSLDAKNFDIKSVVFDGKNEQLKYDYNNAQLTIHLGRTFTRKEEFKIAITYTAKPDERESVGGSAAITSDKGLYFINADGTEDKPRQIWTQGETESNSFWMPTVDKPNERCTQEMYITVEDKFKTLSNGLLISSKKNTDGTRTDYWKMDKPHAPYLFMMAIGEYAVVRDKWRGIDVDYYVEPKFEPYARDIYPYTVEMLDFLSNKLDYPYPWSKFSQVVVRDYVSGAMENTTAVIFGDFMQKTKRELIEDGLTNEKVVMHEMFHQWFGDLVTTESWANLTLNEGFANYSEYLWIEHKHGKDAADDHLMIEQQGYLLSAGDGGHPLIHFGYNDREDMFDAHSYNKGGCILHMLRQQIGDEAFFASLNRYLKKNEYTDVEAAELRLAFEDVTGQDLQWFFNQWFLGAGHPMLNISYSWDESAKKAAVNIVQTQEGAGIAYVFDLPLAVDVYDNTGKATRKNIRVSKRNQTFYFDAATKPALINVDATKTLLCVKNDAHTPDEWAFQFRHAPLFRDRWEALENIQAETTDLAPQISLEALRDKSAAIRLKALSGANPANPEVLAEIERLAVEEPDFQVRATCLSMLIELEDKKYISTFEKGMAPNQSNTIIGLSLMGIYKVDPAAGLVAAKILQNDESDAFIDVLSTLYAENPALENLPFFEQKMDKIDGYPAFQFFNSYQQFLLGLKNQAQLESGIQKLKTVATNLKTSEWRRFATTKGLADMRNALRELGDTEQVALINNIITEIKANETDPLLKTYYDGF